jgi:HlyD family secretion protein
VELTGRVTAIAPTANTQSGVVLYSVTITLAPTSVPVRAGMTADVEIVTNSAQDVLIVPVRAIRSTDGQNYVLRQLRTGEEAPATPTGGQLPQDVPNAQRQQVTVGFTMTPVELGLVTDTNAEIRSGLEEGDMVAVSVQTTNADEASFQGFGMFGGRP